MRLTLRLMGLDVLDIAVDTDTTPPPSCDPGDCTTYPVGFTAPAEEYQVPDRGWDE